MDSIVIIILAIIVFGAMFGVIWYEYHGEDK